MLSASNSKFLEECSRSRQLELPATSRAKSGTESRFPYPCGESNGVRNPSGRIPAPLQGHQDNADAIGVTGNPDIRVPQGVKRDEGLRVARILEKEDAGRDARRDKEENQEGEERTPTETTKTFSVKDTKTNGEPAEGRKLRHVPGGTWLNQGYFCDVTDNFISLQGTRINKLEGALRAADREHKSVEHSLRAQNQSYAA
ncbi:hypothetical protein NDU88_005718 [Pleurodeles waltl]|uniref:Uncharacterized protein n=1 Tax=Pleurodeles waltl TaxID=8319 RepID=A0AAV7PJP6_PLEWA|nr:hypothetical protein NDU88_005718 [Pleurodeles waltl]